MPDSDDRLRGRIAEYLLGELDAELRTEVRDMLERDPESREIVELAQRMRDDLAAREKGYSRSELLAAYVVDPGILDSGQRQELEHHLEGCADCRQERVRLRRVLPPRSPLRTPAGAPGEKLLDWL